MEFSSPRMFRRFSRQRVGSNPDLIPRGVIEIRLLNANGDFNMGWAVCNRKAGDHWSKAVANEIIQGRLESARWTGNINNSRSVDLIRNRLPFALRNKAFDPIVSNIRNYLAKVNSVVS